MYNLFRFVTFNYNNINQLANHKNKSLSRCCNLVNQKADLQLPVTIKLTSIW